MLNYSKLFDKLKEGEEPSKPGTGVLNPEHTIGLVFRKKDVEIEFLKEYEAESCLIELKWEPRTNEAHARINIKSIIELKKILKKSLSTSPSPYAELMLTPKKFAAYVANELFSWDVEESLSEVEAASTFSIRYLNQLFSPIKKGVGPVEIYFAEKSNIKIGTEESALILAPVSDQGISFFERREPYIENGKVLYECDICNEVYWSSNKTCPKCSMAIGVNFGSREYYNICKYGNIIK